MAEVEGWPITIEPPRLEEFPYIANLHVQQKSLGKMFFVIGLINLPLATFLPLNGFLSAFWIGLGAWSYSRGTTTIAEINNSLTALVGPGSFERFMFWASRSYYLSKPEELHDKLKSQLGNWKYVYGGRNGHFWAYEYWHTLEANVYAASGGSCIDIIVGGKKAKKTGEGLLEKLSK